MILMFIHEAKYIVLFLVQKNFYTIPDPAENVT